eukprot:7940403-Lingulodinium_polyedra.AAC.1
MDRWIRPSIDQWVHDALGGSIDRSMDTRSARRHANAGVVQKGSAQPHTPKTAHFYFQGLH